MEGRVREVLIVGGGLIGSAIGWRLAKEGVQVTIVERDPPGLDHPTAAGWAAAGMLAPVSEASFKERELLALGQASLAMYPDFVSELESDAGIPVDYRTDGTLLVALDADDAAWLDRLHDLHRSLGLPATWMSGSGARERVPALSPSVTAAVYAPADHQVDNRRLFLALRRAFRSAGGEMLDGVEVVRIDHGGGRVTGAEVRAADGTMHRVRAGRVVVAAGAWSRLLMKEGFPASLIPPVRPVKGQLLALEMTRLLELHAVVRTRRVYLAPKTDGRLVVGATSEEVGFDRRLTAGGVLELLRDAWETVPGIYDLPLVETWTGLRPGSRDNAPIIGATSIEGLFLATGHHRNGVLLAPVTAAAFTELFRTGALPEVMRPFTLERFSSSVINA